MSDNSRIEWTDRTWNPVVGCDRVSAGCAHCYAVRDSWRMGHNPNPKIAGVYEGLVERQPNDHLDWTGVVRLVPERLEQPLRWRTPRRVFVNSQSDLFHESLHYADIARVFAVMLLSTVISESDGRLPHTFQILTKRPERMNAFVEAMAPEADSREGWAAHLVRLGMIPHVSPPSGIDALPIRWPLPNVWLGVSVENQAAADERIPHLLRTPAAVRFISAEPLLGPVNLRPYLYLTDIIVHEEPDWTGDHVEHGRNLLGWVIAGGESGPGARPAHPDWFRSLRDQCQAAGVAYFFKQHGDWAQIPVESDRWGDVMDGQSRVWLSPLGRTTPFREHGWIPMERIGKHAAGRLLDGRTWDEYPSAGVLA